MIGFAVRRLLSGLLVLVITSFLTFTFFYEAPVNPAYGPCVARGVCTPEKLAAIEDTMGFNDGLFTNYGRFMGGLVHDRTVDVGARYHCDAPCLGISYHTRGEVSKELLTYFPASASLALGGGVVILFVGLVLGVLAARFRGSWLDKILVGGSLVVASVPYYVLAATLWIFFTLKLGVLDSGYVPITDDPTGWFRGLLLPWLVLGVTGAATYVRFVRGHVIETLSEDFIRSGQAKGLRRRTLLFRHALRVAIVPVVTIFGLDLAALLSGTVFTEAIFRVDGIGRWTLTSLNEPIDFPVITASILVFTAFAIVGNLVVDLLYAVLDPRVHYD